MSNPWFRMYSEWLDDEKVQMLSFEMQRHMVALFCLRCQKPTESMSDEQIGFRLKVDETLLKQIKKRFIEANIVDENWSICNWNKRQYISDLSTDRVRAHRERQALKQDETLLKQDDSVSCNVIEQNRTETEQNIKAGELVDSWNRLSGKLPKVEKLTDGRRRKINTRLHNGLTLPRFEQAISSCLSKPFLSGDNATGWMATFDWLMECDENIEKAINNPYGQNSPKLVPRKYLA